MRMVLCVSGKDIFGYAVQANFEDLENLSSSELHTWNIEKQFRRFRMDWLSGRIAAKLTVRDLLEEHEEQPISLDSLIVENDTYGVPYLSLTSKEPIKISISHSNGIGIAVGSKTIKGLGCDIEIIKQRSPKIYKLFLSDSELIFWKVLDVQYNQEILNTVIWSSKEAAIKCLGSSHLVNDLTIKDLFTQPSQSGIQDFLFSYQSIQGKGSWMIYEDYIISIAIIN